VETQICLALLRLEVPINRDWTFFFSQDLREIFIFQIISRRDLNPV